MKECYFYQTSYSIYSKKKKMKSIMFNFLYVVSEFLKTTDSAQGFTVSAITVELDIPISKQSWITIFSL